jgi:hypothetical protein
METGFDENRRTLLAEEIAESHPTRREPPPDIVENACTNNVLLFPVLTEAALKQYDTEAALTLRIAAGTSQEILKFASDRIIDHLARAMDHGVFYATVEEVALQITRCAERLTEIAELILNAPNCPEAGKRLRDWFGPNL